jgi:hypothetical protein
VGREGPHEMTGFRYPDFTARTPQFGEGFFAFFENRQNNPYIDYRHTPPKARFAHSREWQHGYDVAFLLNQFSINEAGEP